MAYKKRTITEKRNTSGQMLKTATPRTSGKMMKTKTPIQKSTTRAVGALSRKKTY